MLGSKHRAVVALLLLDVFIGAQCFAVAMGEPGSRNGTSSCEEEADDPLLLLHIMIRGFLSICCRSEATIDVCRS